MRMSEETPQQKIARYELVLDAQADEIDKLRAENGRLIDWIMGDANAHTALQSVYNNPQSSETNRVKAASAAIGYEQGKIRDEPPFLELKASIPLTELLPVRLKRCLELEEEQQAELRSAVLLGPGPRNGNGSDDTGS